MDIKTLSTILGMVALLVGGVVAMEDRYITVAKASDLITQTQVDAERGRLETELALAEHELEYLDTQDTEDKDKLERRKRYLESRIEMLEERLITLEDQK